MVLKGVRDKNQQKSEIRKYAILSQPRNVTSFEDEIFQLFSYLYGSKVPKWNFAHIFMWLCSTCSSLRGRPRSFLFDPGGRPPRLLSLLQEVNLLGSFLASRGWPPSLLFDLGGQPLRLLSLLQEVNLWSSFLTWRDWPPSFLFDLQGWPLKLLFPTQELSMGGCHLTPHDSHLPCPTWAAMPQSIARSNSMLG